MNKRKLLQKLQNLMDRSSDARDKDLKKLHKVVKELKHKQKSLKYRLEETSDPLERARLQKDIEVIELQRRKGVAVYRQLKGKDSKGDE